MFLVTFLKTLTLIIIAILFTVSVLAKEVSITTDPKDETSHLELRNITLPNGSEATLYVIKASPITVKIDQDTIVAEHIEFDLENKLMRIIGKGTFTSAEEEVTGYDFTIDLNDNTFETLDVTIATGKINVEGVSATRFPGQIDVLSGDFSPCARCDQEIEDYGFKAEILKVYPGDRLVGFNVTILIRETPIMFLPIMVLPIGPKDKQPRLNIKAGKLDARAEVELDWPYVVGASAFGYSSFRYYADVTPGKGNFLTERFFGGRPDVNYFGGGIVHNFFYETGKGKLEFFYLPAFKEYTITDGERKANKEGKKDEITFKIQYDSFGLENLPVKDTEVHFLLERLDSRKQRLAEYKLELLRKDLGLQTRFFSQGFFDLDSKDDVKTPSYTSYTSPNRTLAELQIQPLETTFILGPLQLSNLKLELGLFESDSNPANRSAAKNPLAQAARLLVGHSLVFTTPEPWSGFRLNFENNFIGKYYSTQNVAGSLADFERLINWNSKITLEQRITSIVSFNIVAQRIRNEGETPFRFDSQGNQKQTDITATFSLTPASWLSLNISESYTFENDRDRDLLGWGNVKSVLKLFDDLSWVSISLTNEYDVKENDPGILTSEISLNAPTPSLIAQVTVKHIQDLKPKKADGASRIVDDSKADLNLELGYRLDFYSEPLVNIAAKTSYTYDPDELTNSTDNLKFEYWEPFEVTFNANSPDWQGLSAFANGKYFRDLNRNAPTELDIGIGISYAPLKFEIKQSSDYSTAGQTASIESDYSVRWQSIAKLAFKTKGIGFIPSNWLKLDLPKDRLDTYSLVLEDDNSSDFSWAVSYNTTYDPNLAVQGSKKGGFKDTTFKVNINTQPFYIGGINFYIANSYATLKLADDDLKNTFLQDAKLTFASDWFGFLGLQGDLAYSGGYDSTKNKLTRASLSLKDVAITMRLFEDFYVSTVFNDVWDFTEGASKSQSPWNFQPVVYVTWDRCCWSFYSSWDTQTGAISLGFKLGSSNKGIRERIDTPLVLPGRSITN